MLLEHAYAHRSGRDPQIRIVFILLCRTHPSAADVSNLADIAMPTRLLVATVLSRTLVVSRATLDLRSEVGLGPFAECPNASASSQRSVDQLSAVRCRRAECPSGARRATRSGTVLLAVRAGRRGGWPEPAPGFSAAGTLPSAGGVLPSDTREAGGSWSSCFGAPPRSAARPMLLRRRAGTSKRRAP